MWHGMPARRGKPAAHAAAAGRRRSLHWQVSDDGAGLGSLQVALQRGNGLAGIRQRVWALGGDLDCEVAHDRHAIARAVCAPRALSPAGRRAAGGSHAFAAALRPTRAVRVLLVDDHAVVREGYRRLLELEPDMMVVAECRRCRHRRVRSRGQWPPDVLVLDLSMPGCGGLALLRHAAETWPTLRVLVFTMHDSADHGRAGAACRCRGLHHQEQRADVLVEAVRRVAEGERPVLSADVAQRGGVRRRRCRWRRAKSRCCSCWCRAVRSKRFAPPAI